MFRSVEIGTNQKRQESHVYFPATILTTPAGRAGCDSGKRTASETKGKRANKEQKTIKARQKGLS